MATRGRSYTTYFNADSSGFSKGVGQMVEALEKANKALVNNQYRQKDCNKAISDAQKEIRKIEQEQKEKGKLDEEQTKKLKELNDTIEQEKVKLAQLKTEQAGIKGTISSLSKEIAGNNKEWTALKATMANLASDGIELLSRKLLQLGKSVISTGEQFSSSMSEVGAISGASAEQLKLLEQTAREYGASTRFSASESAQALKYMALAGWDTEQSISSLGSVLDLAAAGNMDLARASDIVTDYITAFGLSAEDSAHFVDVMAYAMAHSNTNVEQLGEAYKNCAASAASMGYSVEDVTAVLMTMANAGVKGGEAGTTLNAIMTRLATDTKGCASELESMGIEIFDENDNLKSLSEILELVTSAFEGMSDKQQAALSKVIAGQNQYTGLQTILKGMSESARNAGQSFGDYTSALEKCDGTSKDMAKTMSDNLSGDLKTMQSAFEELALKVYEDGETPLRDLVQFVTRDVVPGIDTLIAHADKIVPVFVGAAAAVGSYKATLAITSIIKGITQATAGLTAAKGAEKIATDEAARSQAALNAVQAANPIGLVVSLIGALVAGLTSYAIIAGGAADKTEELNRSHENYLQTLQDAQAAAIERKSQTEADIAALESLKSTYDELRSKVNLTTGEEKQLEAIVTDLSSTLGISVEKLKDKDGKYKSLSGSIDEYIEKLREEIRLESSKEQLTAAYKSYNAASEGYTKASQAVEKQKQKVEELKKANEENYKLIEEMNEFTDHGGTLEYETYKQKYEPAVLKIDELEKEQAELKKLQDDLGEYQFQVVQAAGAVGELEEEIGSSTSALDREDQLVKKAIFGIGELGKKADDSSDDLSDLGKKAEEIAERLEELRNESASLRSELSSLSGTYQSLSDGQELSLDTLLQLAEKYPEYAAQLLSAAGNADKQREAVKALYEAKRSELILTLEKAKQEIAADNDFTDTALENAKKRLAAIESEAAAGAIWANSNVSYIRSLREEIDKLSKTRDTINAYDDAIKRLKNTDINSYKPSGGSSGSGSSGSSPGSVTWTTTGGGEVGTGSSRLDAMLNWADRMATMGKLTDRQLKAYYEKWLKEEKLTADESYNLRSRLKTLTDKLSDEQVKRLEESEKKRQETEKNKLDAFIKTTDNMKSLGQLSLKAEIDRYNYALKHYKATEEQKTDIAKRRYNAEKQLRQQSLEYARAAYEKLAGAQISKYEQQIDRMQSQVQKNIDLLDKRLEQRQQKQEDEARSKEIKEIDDELYYNGGRLTQIEKDTLYRRKQDILNEQKNIDFERNTERLKEQLQEKSDAGVKKNTEAIERLQAAIERANYYLAGLSGTRTAAQIVNNSSRTQNIQYVANGFGLSYEQFLKMIY